MTLKTVRTNRQTVVTGITELTLSVDRLIATSIICTGMTIDACGQAIFDPSVTFDHHLIPIMLQIFHVVTADLLSRCNTGVQRSSLGTLGYEAALSLCLQRRNRQGDSCKQTCDALSS
jgi:hypothetical protein